MLAKQSPHIPVLLGNALEWYDFACYGYFASIISRLFFPAHDETTALLLTFSVFAMGFILRPLGGVIFGCLGDKFGRRNMLAWSMGLMALATGLMGLLPTYHNLGVTAAWLMLVSRLLQGLSAGGELSGTITFLVEHAQDARRGYQASWVLVGSFAGILLASGVNGLVSLAFSKQVVMQWAWRMPFLLGGVLGVFGLYVRLRLQETPLFLRARQQQREGVADVTAVRQFMKHCLQVAGMNLGCATGFYMCFVYLPTFMHTQLGAPLSSALLVNSANLLLLCLITPLGGALSDRWGRKPVFLAGMLGLVVLSYPLFMFMVQATALHLWLAQAMFALCIAACFGPLPAAVAEIPVTMQRYRVLSVGYNISAALFGGTVPLVAMLLIKHTHNLLSPSFYVMAMAMLTVIFTAFYAETSKMVLR